MEEERIPMTKKEEYILLDGNKDCEITPEALSVWVGVKDFSIYIVKTDEGVVVDIFARGCEGDECLGSTYVFDQEAKEVIDAKND